MFGADDMRFSDDIRFYQMPAIFGTVFACFESVFALIIFNYFWSQRKFNKEGETDAAIGAIISKLVARRNKRTTLCISVEFEATRASDGMQLRVRAEQIPLCGVGMSIYGDAAWKVTPPLEGDDLTLWDTLQPGRPVTITHLKDDPTKCRVKRAALTTVDPVALVCGWIRLAVSSLVFVPCAVSGPYIIISPFIIGTRTMNSVAILGPLFYVTVISVWIIVLRSSRLFSGWPDVTVTELGYEGGYARMEPGSA